MTIHKGGCHCGKVQFEVEADADLELHDCNCSICRMSGGLHLIVPTTSFRLIRGENDLSCYSFNTGIAKHYFCRHCGIKSFYVPRSNPDGYSVNAGWSFRLVSSWSTEDIAQRRREKIRFALHGVAIGVANGWTIGCNFVEK